MKPDDSICRIGLIISNPDATRTPKTEYVGKIQEEP